MVSGELYYLDGSGNAVQITSGGTVNGGSASITTVSGNETGGFCGASGAFGLFSIKDTADSFVKL